MRGPNLCGIGAAAVAGRYRKRPTRRLLPVIVGAAALLPAPLYAQASGSIETGTLRPVAPAGGFGTTKDQVRLVVRKFAACSIARKRVPVENFLAMPFGGPDFLRMRRQVLQDECLGAGELSMRDDIIRGALFDVLYSLDFGRSKPIDVSGAPAIDYQAELPADATGSARQIAEMARFGDCVSRADQADVRLLLLSAPDTRAEQDMIGLLAPRLGPCVPQGITTHLTKSVLRGALAEGMYRLSRAASGRPWGVKA